MLDTDPDVLGDSTCVRRWRVWCKTEPNRLARGLYCVLAATERRQAPGFDNTSATATTQ